MLYSIAVLEQTVDDVKRIMRIGEFLSQLVYVTYLAFCIAFSRGFLIPNIILLVMSVAFLAFYIPVLKNINKPRNRWVSASDRHIYKRTKLFVQCIIIMLSVVDIILSDVQSASPISLLFTSVMIMCIIFQIAFEVIYEVVKARVCVLAAAFEKDKQTLNPVNKAKDLFDRVTGKEKEPEPPTKMDIYLDRILTEQEENKKLKKQDKSKCGLFSFLKRKGKATSSENGTEKTKDYQHK